MRLQNRGCPACCAPFIVGPDPATLLFFDVTTPIATLRSPFPLGLDAIFDDLGSGQLFGTHTLENVDYSLVPGLLNGTIVSIPLNGTAIDAINAARGQLFAIGGVIAPNEFGSIFADSASPLFARELVLTTDATAVPEPGTRGLVLFAFSSIGLGCLGWIVAKPKVRPAWLFAVPRPGWQAPPSNSGSSSGPDLTVAPADRGLMPNEASRGYSGWPNP